jgi:hypothetical protein
MIDVYLTDTITRFIAGVLDEWNERSYATEEIPAMVTYKSKLVRNLRGEEVVTNVQIMLKVDQEISHKDRIQLEGESFTHGIINFSRPRDFSDVMKEVSLE